MGKKLFSKQLTCSSDQALNNESTNPDFLSQNLLFTDQFRTDFNLGIKINKKKYVINYFLLTKIRQFTAL